MITQKIKPQSIGEYINASPVAVQEKLHQLHACILKAAPDAEEALKWGMPAYSNQKILVTFKAFKNHIGFYPMASAIAKFATDLAKYNTAKGSVQFPLNEPLPLSLIRKIVKFRVKENEDGIIKWKS